MTARQGWEALLTELSKVNAPSMLLSDFNYFCNKAIYQYINKRYNVYDINLQSTDDLRVLKATTILKPKKVELASEIEGLNSFGAGLSKLFGATYEIHLPLDYLHMLNCICIYRVNGRHKCYSDGDTVLFAAKRLTADAWPIIMNDYYSRPLPERPYYYIHNVNTHTDLPTNPVRETINSDTKLTRDFKGTDANSDYSNSSYNVIYVYKYVEDLEEQHGIFGDPQYELDTFREEHPNAEIIETAIKHGISNERYNLPRKISLRNINNDDLVEREAGVRYGNSSSIRCEIRCGHDNTVFELVGVMIDYIKTPLTIRLTQEQVNLTKDTSLILEFPDYVCQEIINELVMLVMENTADPRLATREVTTSIANPAQQLAPQQTTRRRRRYDNE